MAEEYPVRDPSLKADILGPVGLLAEGSLPVAATCLAFDWIGARGWSSYGWASDPHGQMRRGWLQNRQNKGLLLAFGAMSLLTLSPEVTTDIQRPGGGWLNLVVRPSASGSGSTIEIRGDLNAEMYTAVRSVVRSLFVTVIRVWDPTLP